MKSTSLTKRHIANKKNIPNEEITNLMILMNYQLPSLKPNNIHVCAIDTTNNSISTFISFVVVNII